MLTHKEAFIRKNILYGHALSHTCTNSEFHFHDHYEIYLFLSGDVTLFVNDRSYKPVRGDLFLFNSTDIHKSLNHAHTAYERYCIHFLPAIMAGYSTEQTDLLSCFHDDSKKIIHLSSKEVDLFSTKIKEMISVQQRTEYGYDVLVRSALAEILVKINLSSLAGTPVPQGMQNSMIADLILYINEHIQEDLTLSQLAKKCSTDKNYLCKVFKSSTGSTLWQYIIAKRISIAKQFLIKGFSIQDTYTLSGFNSYTHFARTFKNVVGMSAREYQQTYYSKNTKPQE